MASLVAEQSFELSKEHFSHPDSYGHLTYTEDDRVIIDCIEPRNPEGVPHGSYDVTIQTPGGGSGEGLVGAIALTIARGEFIGIEDALIEDEQLRTNNILAAHRDCTFIREMGAITAEMAKPSDPTIENYRRWSVMLGHEELAISSMHRVKEASAQQQEDIGNRDHMGHLLTHIDRLHPEHVNVRDVHGDPGALVYVVNLHPNIGQDRNKHPLNTDGTQAVRAYHSGLGASLVELDKATELSDEERGLRIAAKLAVDAATLTVIKRHNPDMAIFEVMRSTSHSSRRQITELES